MKYIINKDVKRNILKEKILNLYHDNPELDCYEINSVIKNFEYFIQNGRGPLGVCRICKNIGLVCDIKECIEIKKTLLRKYDIL